MKRKLIIVLIILLFLSIAIGTSPIVDYFYSLGAEAQSSVSVSDTATPVDEIHPKTVIFAVILSSLTVVVAFIVYLKKRRV